MATGDEVAYVLDGQQVQQVWNHGLDELLDTIPVSPTGWTDEKLRTATGGVPGKPDTASGSTGIGTGGSTLGSRSRNRGAAPVRSTLLLPSFTFSHVIRWTEAAVMGDVRHRGCHDIRARHCDHACLVIMIFRSAGRLGVSRFVAGTTNILSV